MRLSKSEQTYRDRPTVWPRIFGVCALGLLVAIWLCEPWLKSVAKWLPVRLATAARKPVDRDAPDDDPIAGFEPVRREPEVFGGARPASDSVVHDIGLRTDADAALFTALERLERRVAAAMSLARQSVVALEYTAVDAAPESRRIASGVVISGRGDVLSVRIDPPPAQFGETGGEHTTPPTIVARDFSGRRQVAHWVAADPQTGLTLLRLSPGSVRPIRIADNAPNLGSQVFIVGNPFGMGHSVSRGHVAGLDRTLELGTRQLGGLLQVQAPLYPGDSGAPVVNLRGHWLGLIRGGLAIPGSGSGRGTEAESIIPLPSSAGPVGFSPSMPLADNLPGSLEPDNDFGFAVPARDALWIADQLRTQGRVDRAYLGVRLETHSSTGSPLIANGESKRESGTTNRVPEISPFATAAVTSETEQTLAPIGRSEGAVLHEVLAATPAADAGLKPGDTIVALDGRPIRSTHDLTDRLDHIRARTTIVLSVVRGLDPRQQSISLSVRTASRPDPARLAQLVASFPPPVSKRSALPLALTATAAPAVPRSTASTSPTMRLDRVSAHSEARVESSPPGSRTQSHSPTVEPNEPRLALPRAVVDRLEYLERRIEQLESSASRVVGVPRKP